MLICTSGVVVSALYCYAGESGFNPERENVTSKLLLTVMLTTVFAVVFMFRVVNCQLVF